MTVSSAAASLGLILFPLAMVYAGVMDLATMKIRNHLVLAVGAAWLILAPLAGFSLEELGMSLGVAGIVFVVTFVFFGMGWIGGGDAKLAAVTALWFAPQQALEYFLYASLLGGILTILVLKLRGSVLPLSLYRLDWIAQLYDQRGGVPYGAAMAPAALIVFPSTAWLAHAVG